MRFRFIRHAGAITFLLVLFSAALTAQDRLPERLTFPETEALQYDFTTELTVNGLEKQEGEKGRREEYYTGLDMTFRTAMQRTEKYEDGQQVRATFSDVESRLRAGGAAANVNIDTTISYTALDGTGGILDVPTSGAIGKMVEEEEVDWETANSYGMLLQHAKGLYGMLLRHAEWLPFPLPEKGMTLPTTWQVSQKTNVTQLGQQIHLDGVMQYQCNRTVDTLGTRCAVISYTMEDATLSKERNPTMKNLEAEMTAHGTIKEEGTAYLDLSTGHVIYKESNTAMDLTFGFALPGDSDVGVTYIMKMISKTSARLR